MGAIRPRVTGPDAASPPLECVQLPAGSVASSARRTDLPPRPLLGQAPDDGCAPRWVPRAGTRRATCGKLRDSGHPVMAAGRPLGGKSGHPFQKVPASRRQITESWRDSRLGLGRAWFDRIGMPIPHDHLKSPDPDQTREGRPWAIPPSPPNSGRRGEGSGILSPDIAAPPHSLLTGHRLCPDGLDRLDLPDSTLVEQHLYALLVYSPHQSGSPHGDQPKLSRTSAEQGSQASLILWASDMMQSLLLNGRLTDGSIICLSREWCIYTASARSPSPSFILSTVPVHVLYGPRNVSYIDIFARANGPFSKSIRSNVSYVSITATPGTLTPPANHSDSRSYLDVDWPKAPTEAPLTITGTTKNNSTNTKNDSNTLTISTSLLPINKTTIPPNFTGLIESNDVISIEPTHWTPTTTITTTSTQTASASYTMVYIENPILRTHLIRRKPLTRNNPLTNHTHRPKDNLQLLLLPAPSAKPIVLLSDSLNRNPTRPLKPTYSLDTDEPETVLTVGDYQAGSMLPDWDTAVTGIPGG
ncbi:glycoside hydrolase family 115 protein [Aspergillus affinis]|uniref:glycoside hydrolase family 115 protein n=1 Tax=Aspergillus affinis TaxID=1070780 RepID=UPI0022FE6194|nr:uncharacterized protein KD926_008846 [Aspergillus affinis]KAI9045419.1 hypothetical protein KD926_008846 [Aspergillus affinis]